MSSKNEDKKIKINPKWILILIAIIILIILIARGVIISTNEKKQSKMLEIGLKNNDNLVTQSCITTIIKDSEKDIQFFNKFSIPLTKSRLIFSYDFEVDAGVKFSDIDFDIDNHKKIITFKMPHASIYKTYTILDSFKSYLDENGIGTKFDSSDRNSLLKGMEDEAKDKCEKYDLIDNADSNAKTIVTNFIKSNSELKDYKVKFEYKK